MTSEDVRAEHQTLSPLYADMNLLLQDRMQIQSRNQQFLASLSRDVGRLVEKHPADREQILEALAAGFQGHAEETRFAPYGQVYSIARQMREIAIDTARESVHLVQDVQMRLGLTQVDDQIFDVVLDAVRQASYAPPNTSSAGTSDARAASAFLHDLEASQNAVRNDKAPYHTIDERFAELRDEVGTLTTALHDALDRLPAMVADLDAKHRSRLDSTLEKQRESIEQMLSTFAKTFEFARDSAQAKVLDGEARLDQRLTAFQSAIETAIDAKLARVESAQASLAHDLARAIAAPLETSTAAVQNTTGRVDELEKRWSAIVDEILLARQADQSGLHELHTQVQGIAEHLAADRTTNQDALATLHSRIEASGTIRLTAAFEEQKALLERSIATIADIVSSHLANTERRFNRAEAAIERRVETLADTRQSTLDAERITEALSAVKATMLSAIDTGLSRIETRQAGLSRDIDAAIGAALAPAMTQANTASARLEQRWADLLDETRLARKRDEDTRRTLLDMMSAHADGNATERAAIHRTLTDIQSRLATIHAPDLSSAFQALHGELQALVDERTAERAALENALALLRDQIAAESDERKQAAAEPIAALRALHGQVREIAAAVDSLPHQFEQRVRPIGSKIEQRVLGVRDHLDAQMTTTYRSIAEVAATSHAAQTTLRSIREAVGDLPTRLDAQIVRLDGTLAARTEPIMQIAARTPDILADVVRLQADQSALLTKSEKALALFLRGHRTGHRATKIAIDALNRALTTAQAAITDALETGFAKPNASETLETHLRGLVAIVSDLPQRLEAHALHLDDTVAASVERITQIAAGAPEMLADLTRVHREHSAVFAEIQRTLSSLTSGQRSGQKSSREGLDRLHATLATMQSELTELLQTLSTNAMIAGDAVETIRETVSRNAAPLQRIDETIGAIATTLASDADRTAARGPEIAEITEMVRAISQTTQTTGTTVEVIRESVLQTERPLQQIDRSMANIRTTLETADRRTATTLTAIDDLAKYYEHLHTENASILEQLAALYTAASRVPTAHQVEAIQRMVTSIEARLAGRSNDVADALPAARETIARNSTGSPTAIVQPIQNTLGNATTETNAAGAVPPRGDVLRADVRAPRAVNAPHDHRNAARDHAPTPGVTRSTPANGTVGESAPLAAAHAPTFKRVPASDLLTTPVDALVVPVNLVGVAGAGFAKAAADLDTAWESDYRRACETGSLQIGAVHTFDRGAGVVPRYIISVATKRHWRDESRLDDVIAGIDALPAEITRIGATSIAIPDLGADFAYLETVEIFPRLKRAFAGTSLEIQHAFEVI